MPATLPVSGGTRMRGRGRELPLAATLDW